MTKPPVVGRRFTVRGRVQGVGFRYFVQRAAAELSLTGWVRNEDDGSVEVYAAGPEPQVSHLKSLIGQGPRGAEVRQVEERSCAIESRGGFEIEG